MQSGKADARHTLAVVVDPGCAPCARREAVLGRTMRELDGKGAYRIEYRIATDEDDARCGQGSRRAANALGTVASEGPEKFVRYLGAVLAGRSGREESNGDALASARRPWTAALVAVVTQDRHERPGRRPALARLPPQVRS